MEMKILQSLIYTCCGACGSQIAEISDLFNISEEGSTGVYINPHGYIHEIGRCIYIYLFCLFVYLPVIFASILDFTTFLIWPNSAILNDHQKKQVIETIDILKLNDDDELVMERAAYHWNYLNREITLTFLKEKAPFIAYEVIRQGLMIT